MKRVGQLGPLAWPRPRQRTAEGAEIDRAVTRMAWPVIVENLLHTLLGVVDMILVGALGAAALAGVGAALQVLWVIQSGFSAITTGTTVLVSHAIGAGQRGEAERVLKQSLLVGLGVSAIVGVAGTLFAEPIIRVVGGEPDVVAAGATYFRIAAITGVFMLIMFIVGAALRGAGDSHTPMRVTLVTNVINAALAWVLIYGRFGFPALGVAGSAWAAGIARGVGMLWLLLILLRGQGRLRLDWRGAWAPDTGLLARTLRIGVPSMGEMLMMSGGMLIYGMFAMRLGTAVYAAQRITLSAISFSFMPGLGYAMAATALTGQSLGAKDPERARLVTWRAAYSALALMTLVAVIMFVAGRPIMRVYTSDERIIQIGADALKVIALSQPFHAIGQVLAGGLRGAGDTRFAMASTGGAIWLVRLPLAYLFGPVFHWSLAAIYLSNLADSVVRMALVWRRFRQGRWQFIKV